jgi:predicted RNA binding protein YcfA (HicA-like mRNA interferase family)
MPTSRELIGFLLRQGYRKVRQTGSHLILEHQTRLTLTVPVHHGDLPKGLFHKILKQAGFDIEEFRRG